MNIKILKSRIEYFLDDAQGLYYKSWYDEIEIDYDEEWKDFEFPIKLEGFKISNYGRLLRPNGTIAPQYYDKDGYQRVSIYVKDFYGEKKHLRRIEKTHRLVAYHFIPNDNPEIKAFVMHKNDVRDCNFYSNLEWGTPQENMAHKMKFGRHRVLFGEDKPEAKHSENLVINICELLEKGLSKIDILSSLELISDDEVKNKSYKILVTNLKRRHIWKHITKKYKY